MCAKTDVWWIVVIIALLGLSTSTCAVSGPGSQGRDKWLIGNRAAGIRVGFEGENVVLEMTGRTSLQPAVRMTCGDETNISLHTQHESLCIGTKASSPGFGLGLGAEKASFSCGNKVVSWHSRNGSIDMGLIGQGSGVRMHWDEKQPSSQMQSITELGSGEIAIACGAAMGVAKIVENVILKDKLIMINAGSDVKDGLVFGVGSDRSPEDGNCAFMDIGNASLLAGAVHRALNMGYDKDAQKNNVKVGLVDGRAGLQLYDSKTRRSRWGFEKEQ